MALPFFYSDQIKQTVNELILDEETSKHIVQVLRMQNGEQLNLTDGKGNLYTSTITDNNKKACTVQIESQTQNQPSTNHTSIAISILKNTNRLEWFLEKATEIGVREIIPLLCERTERTHFRYDRMNNLLISAMLQSQQTWLPVLHHPTKFDDLVMKQSGNEQKFIAHCEEEKKQSLSTSIPARPTSKIILIGPEGDFTSGEIKLAVQQNFIPVTLGNTRLRSETAGVVAASLLMASCS